MMLAGTLLAGQGGSAKFGCAMQPFCQYSLHHGSSSSSRRAEHPAFSTSRMLLLAVTACHS